MKTLQYWHKNRQKTDRTEDPETNPFIYSDLIFNKEAQKYVAEKTASSINGSGKTGYP
jgi:hypothetical protein